MGENESMTKKVDKKLTVQLYLDRFANGENVKFVGMTKKS